MPKRPDAEVFTAEAVEILNVHPSTISRWVENGTLTPTRKAPGLRGAYIFRRSDIERLAKQRSAA